MNETIEEMLVRHEGFIPYAYQDSLGYWTIGIGRLIDKRKGGRITRAEANMLLRNDIIRFEDSLAVALPWYKDLTYERQVVLINMCFNLGINGLLGFKNTLKLIQDGKYKEASRAMLQSKWAAQVGDRAIELSRMMEGEKK